VALADDAADAATAAKLASVRADRDRWRNLHDRVAAKAAGLEDRLDALSRLADEDLDPPKWAAPKRPGKHDAIVTAILSDCHWDEVVNPDEIGGVNAYDREIATQRLRHWATSIVEQFSYYVTNIKITGCVVMIGGDLLTGNLHDLAETNEDHLPGSLVYWSEQLAAALMLLADAFGKVHCPVVVGNHGRLTKKPRTKGRARDNLDWLLPQMAAAHLKGDQRISFAIGDDPDAWVEVFDTTYLLTHGDQAKGGGGIGGIWPPIMRLAARKRQRYGRDFILCMGHWHQLIMAPGQGLVVNGSPKGYDEYVATILNAPPERPQQAVWLTTPEHGPTMQVPIFCDDRQAEGW